MYFTKGKDYVSESLWRPGRIAILFLFLPFINIKEIILGFLLEWRYLFQAFYSLFDVGGIWVLCILLPCSVYLMNSAINYSNKIIDKKWQI